MNKKGKFPPNKAKQVILRFISSAVGSGMAVIASESPIQRFDESKGYVVSEVLLMDGCVFRGGRNQIPIVDSHDDTTVRNILGSIRNMQINRTTGELFGMPAFAADADAQVIRGRFDDGHITDFSITADPLDGFFVQRGQSFTTPRGNVIEGPANIYTAWEPHNASICATGADVNSTVRRSYLDLARKVSEMDKSTMDQLAALGLPAGMVDPVEIIAWLLARDAADDATVEASTTATPPVAPPLPVATPVPAPVAVLRSVIDAEVKRALDADHIRRKAIYADCKLGKLERSFAEELCDSGLTLEVARERIVRQMATTPLGTTPTDTNIRVTESEDDKFYAAARDGLIMRMRGSRKTKIPAFDAVRTAAPGAEDFKHVKLLRLAEYCLKRAKINTDRMIDRDIAMVAMGHEPTITRLRIQREAWHTSGTFANLLTDGTNNSLQSGYDEAQYTWDLWARQGESVSDFGPINRLKLSEAPNLDMIPEGHEYQEGALSDLKESYKVEKFGKLFSITWEAVIGDRLNAFSRIPAMHGVAARRTQNKNVYQVLTANALMSDGKALFATDHASGSNLVTAGGPPTTTTLSAAYAAMMTQKGLNGVTDITAIPAFILAPVALSGAILELLGSISVPTAGGSNPGNSGTFNIYGPDGSRTLTPIFDPTLDANSTTAWYLVAGNDTIDTVELTFLEGEETPVLEVEWDYLRDVWTHKVRQTFGTKALDWRGLFQNDGVT